MEIGIGQLVWPVFFCVDQNRVQEVGGNLYRVSGNDVHDDQGLHSLAGILQLQCLPILGAHQNFVIRFEEERVDQHKSQVLIIYRLEPDEGRSLAVLPKDVPPLTGETDHSLGHTNALIFLNFYGPKAAGRDFQKGLPFFLDPLIEVGHSHLDSQSVFLQDPVVNLLPIHHRIGGGLDAQADLFPLDIDHVDLDFVPNGDKLADLSNQDQHFHPPWEKCHKRISRLTQVVEQYHLVDAGRGGQCRLIDCLSRLKLDHDLGDVAILDFREPLLKVGVEVAEDISLHLNAILPRPDIGDLEGDLPLQLENPPGPQWSPSHCPPGPFSESPGY
jgi:hypothetical protein